MALEYFYDSQLRRYLLQVTRVFAQFTYQLTDSDGNQITKTIPSTLASQSFNVAALTTQNTENFAQTAPQFSVYFRDLQMDPESRQTPNFERYKHVTERQIDTSDDSYTGNAGNRYTVQSFMPVPYRMIVTVYLWTTNLNQKCQIMEQLLTVFNPSISLQSNTNPLDWTALTYMEMTSLQWTNNSYPLANAAGIELSSIDFTIPVWINPPSKIKKQTLINKIISNIGKPDDLITDTVGNLWSTQDDLYATVCVTYDNYKVQILDGNKAVLKSGDNGKYNSDGTLPSWKDLVGRNGTYDENKSKIILTYSYLNTDVEVICSFTFTDEPNVIDYTITNYPIPVYTIDGIINPSNTNPENQLKNVPENSSYLILQDINSDYGFYGLTAKTNDIIYFDGDNWLVKYSPSDNVVIFNSRSNKYFIWDNHNWDDIFSGVKDNISWRLSI